MSLPIAGDLLSALVMFAFVASATPGPNNMMVLASGVNYGFRRSIPHMAGIALGFGLMILLVGLGFGQIFERLPWLYTALKVLSIGYMLWLAWKIATAGPVTPDAQKSDARPLTFMEAAAFQWINPKAWTICVAAVAAYTVPSQYLASMFVVAAVFTVVTVPSISAWTLFGVSLRSLLADPKRVRIFNVLMALALVASLWPVVAEYLH
jgi:threonine/homoserine/homoserine lactone efflux protein